MYSSATVQGPSGKVYNIKIDQKKDSYVATIRELRVTVTSQDVESLWLTISKTISDREWTAD